MTDEPQPPLYEPLDATLDARPAGMTAVPPPRSTLRYIFFGREGLRAGWGIALFLLILIAIGASIGGIYRVAHRHPAGTAPGAPAHPAAPAPQPLKNVLLNDGLGFLAIGVATWIMSRVEKRPLADYGFAPRRTAPLFFAGLGWGVLCLSLLIFILWKAHLLVCDSRLLFGSSIYTNGGLWLVGFLCVALAEESLLRGYLQAAFARGLSGIYGLGIKSELRRTLGFWTAALALSFIFGLGHKSNAGESPIGVVSAGLAGFVFCLSLWRTGSLWWAIGFHASWDWAQSFLYGVADSGIMIKGHLLATHPAGGALMSGGETGPEGSIYVLPVLAVVAAILYLTVPRVAHEGSAGPGPGRPLIN